MNKKERELAEFLIDKGYTHLYRDEEDRLYAESHKKTMLLDSTYFIMVGSKIPIELLLALDNGFETPVIYKEKPVIKYRDNISKKRLKQWLELLIEGYYSELRRQLEKEIEK